MSIEDYSYITIQEAHVQTGLSYYYLRSMVLEGKIKHVKSGSKYMINENSLCQFLSEQEHVIEKG